MSYPGISCKPLNYFANASQECHDVVTPSTMGPVPEETTRVAHDAFPGGHLYLRMHDELGPICTDTALRHCLRHAGDPQKRLGAWP